MFDGSAVFAFADEVLGEDPESPTFRVLGEEVLGMRDEQGIRGIARERSRFNCHIVPCDFIDELVTAIPPKRIRAWLRWMGQREARVWDGEPARKLDRATINRAYSLMSVIFAEAVEREIIETNPCAFVKQKKRVGEGDTVKKWAYLTRAEQQAILDCPLISEAQKLAMRFAWGTGMRQGEMFSLELPDLVVAGADPHVFVRYSVPHKGKKMPPKNGTTRTVPLMPDALEAAIAWLEMLPTFAPENHHGLVFPSARGNRRQQGKPLERSIKKMSDVYALAGIAPRPKLHWHALRHTFASNCVIDGMRLEVLRVLMGHHSVEMTQRYAHLGEDDIRREVRALSAKPVATAAEVIPFPPISDRTLTAELDAMADMLAVA